MLTPVFCIVCFLGLYLVFVVCPFFDLSSVLYFPACTDMIGTVEPNCADVPLRNCSLTHSPACSSGESKL